MNRAPRAMTDSLHFLPTPVAHAFVIESLFRHDERGANSRAWCSQEFSHAGIDFIPLQANATFDRKRGTLRGMHYQVQPLAEAKLVRCTSGVVYDVAVDICPDSPTYRKWCGVVLTPGNGLMLYVPANCAHGYVALDDNSAILYLTSQLYRPEYALGVRYDDPAFGIDWPLRPTLLSTRDQSWSLVSNAGVK
jgi:dTDP-4-dehydrorhamnose 3,5-epimerase